jgi:hypothetical protein
MGRKETEEEEETSNKSNSYRLLTNRNIIISCSPFIISIKEGRKET